MDTYNIQYQETDIETEVSDPYFMYEREHEVFNVEQSSEEHVPQYNQSDHEKALTISNEKAPCQQENKQKGRRMNVKIRKVVLGCTLVKLKFSRQKKPSYQAESSSDAIRQLEQQLQQMAIGPSLNQKKMPSLLRRLRMTRISRKLRLNHKSKPFLN